MKLETVIAYMEAAAPKMDPALLSRDVTTFVIDSRETQAGDVFFALSQPEYADNGFNGDFDDATVHVRSAFASGAVACVVRPDRYEEHREHLAEFESRLIFADDVIAGLQKLAHRVYLDWDRPVVAITGSAGKTTAKELTAHVLASTGRTVLRNKKNYNNGLGHPLTVVALVREPGYDIAVLEMGMSTPMHEIERLCRITPPDVAVVLNVLPVHVEHLGSIENVAKAKAEIVAGLKAGGTAVLNADDPRVASMRELVKGSVVTFGIEAPADVRASDIAFDRFGETTFKLATPAGDAAVHLSLDGRHNISNALAAAAVGHAFGMTAEEIASALSNVAVPPQRGQVLRFRSGFTVINDSYNSNPDALLSMVRTLVEGSRGATRRIVVAGEMLELGDDAARLHRDAGREIAALGIERLIGVRGLASELVRGASDDSGVQASFVDSSDAAAEMLAGEIEAGDVVLVKGSRGVRTEKVIERLLQDFELEQNAATNSQGS